MVQRRRIVELLKRAAQWFLSVMDYAFSKRNAPWTVLALIGGEFTFIFPGVLLHELGHAVVADSLGYEIEKITMPGKGMFNEFVVFGFLVVPVQNVDVARAHFVHPLNVQHWQAIPIAFAGPLMTLSLAFGAWFLAKASRNVAFLRIYCYVVALTAFSQFFGDMVLVPVFGGNATADGEIIARSLLSLIKRSFFE